MDTSVSNAHDFLDAVEKLRDNTAGPGKRTAHRSEHSSAVNASGWPTETTD